MCDPRIALHKRRELITRFLKMSPCCLDLGLGRNLLKRFQNVGAEAMLQPKVLRFLVAFFNSIVLSTAFLECGFAKASSWLPRQDKLPQSVTSTVSTSYERIFQAGDSVVAFGPSFTHGYSECIIIDVSKLKI